MLLTYAIVHPDATLEETDFNVSDKCEALDFIKNEVRRCCSPVENPDGDISTDFILHYDDGTKEDLTQYSKQFVCDY